MMNWDNILMQPQQGWQCPVCGRVMSPNTLYCLWCARDVKTDYNSESTGTGIPYDGSKQVSSYTD